MILSFSQSKWYFLLQCLHEMDILTRFKASFKLVIDLYFQIFIIILF